MGTFTLRLYNEEGCKQRIYCRRKVSLFSGLCEEASSMVPALRWSQVPRTKDPLQQSPEKSRLHGCEPEEGFLNLCQF